MALQDYIAEKLEDLHSKQKVDYQREAMSIINNMLNPDYKPTRVNTRKNLTKVESYNSFMKYYSGPVYQAVYNALCAADCALSRAEIAHRANLRLSTVCGRIAELMEAGAISVSGTKIDTDTNRKVEVLIPNLGTSDV